MAFQTRRKKNSIFKVNNSIKIIKGTDINSFNGLVYYDGNNPLNLGLGQLIYNLNMEYKHSGKNKYLKTRNGSTLEKDITLSVLGSGLFNDPNYTFFVWVDNTGNLKYINNSDVITTIQGGLDFSDFYEFFMYGLSGSETLYLGNSSTGLVKVTNTAGVLSYSTVLTSIGCDSFVYSNISGRIFIADGHRAYYSNIQLQSAADTSNLETFDTGAAGQWLWIHPDSGDGIQRIVDDGQITFFFKDTGVWALINAEDDISNWLLPKCNVEVGTKSPKTVVYSRYGQVEGYIFLASDKTLRFFNASVQRNAGTVSTLLGGDGKIISSNFERLLEDIPDGFLANCTSTYHNRYYILNFVSNGGTSVDSSLIIDTEKLLPLESGDDINQPYWFLTNNMNYNSYVLKNNRDLYGFNVNGYLNKLLVKDTYYDEVPCRISTDNDFRDYLTITGVTGTYTNNETITGSISGVTAKIDEEGTTDLLVDNSSGIWTIGETLTGGSSSATSTLSSVVKRIAIDWKSYTSWWKYSDFELQLYDAYLNWKTDGLGSLNFSINTFILGESIPLYDAGINVAIKPQNVDGAYFNQSYFNLAYFDTGAGQLSQNTGKEARGNYFLFGFYNSNYNEWASVFGIEPRFKLSKNTPIGKNI